MITTSHDSILKAMLKHLRSGATLSLAARTSTLKALREQIKNQENNIISALRQDLGKGPAEAYVSEIGLTLKEISYFINKLPKLMKARRLPTPLALWPSSSRLFHEPLGIVLVLSPWNYPLQLALMPLVAALAAGNCVVLAPSSGAPATAALIETLVKNSCPPELAFVAQGGAGTAAGLLEKRFDFIFYTGSQRVGKLVMQAAARNLTPLCLELGGKSPVIVAADANLELAAKRIAWGKILNAGQTCVAPDYIWADEKIAHPLRQALDNAFSDMLGHDPINNPEYGRIINEQAFDRLLALSNQPLVFNRPALKIAPQVLAATPQDAIMQEEIFGPLLPLLTYDDVEQAICHINSQGKPLALYLFTSDQALQKKIFTRLSFGGGCINDVVIQAASAYMPFGGVGMSGMGRYHGRAGFELFSNAKGVMRSPTWLDQPLRYPPYCKNFLSLIKIMLR